MTKELKGPGFHFDVHTDLRADQKAEVLIEALPWLEEFAGQRIVIKYGGNAACIRLWCMAEARRSRTCLRLWALSRNSREV